MDTVFLLSSIALGLSAIAALARLFGFTLTTDPRMLIRLGQWALFFFAVAALPAIVVLLVLQQWTAAMLVATGLLLSVALLNWRLLAPRRGAFRPAWQDGEPSPAADDGAPGTDERELVARAAAVLEAYLDHAGASGADPRLTEARRAPRRRADEEGQSGPMSRPEALSVLGLDEGADDKAVRAAHRRLVQLLHPDRGGTNYLATKVNQAKDTLLAGQPAEPSRNRPRPAKPKRAAPTAY